MPSHPKSSRTQNSTEKFNSASGSSSSHCRPTPLPKSKSVSGESPHPHYLIVDSTLPSHVFNDRSLFTTYVPSRRLHQTVFGTDLVIEGIGEVHIHVVASGKSILFRFHDSWYVPSSPHHFLSSSTAISLGNQIMLAGRSPRIIFSHQKRLAKPNLPKYIPFTRINNIIALKFDIPVPSSSPQSASVLPTKHLTTTTALSLPASLSHPFAGLSFTQLGRLLSSTNPLYILDRLDVPTRVLPVFDDVAHGGAVTWSAVTSVAVDHGLGGAEDLAAGNAGLREHADVMSDNMSLPCQDHDVGADVLPVDANHASFLLTVDANAASYGGAPDVQMTMLINGFQVVHALADQAVKLCEGGDPFTLVPDSDASPLASLNSFDLDDSSPPYASVFTQFPHHIFPCRSTCS